MSYSNGRIYVDTSKTPNVGVSIYDVQRALSTNRQDLGELCTHANINRWARFKPERMSGITPISHGQQIGEIRTRKNNGFGLLIPYCGSLNDMGEKVNDILTNNGYARDDAWAYLTPRGLSYNEPYRLTDFVSKPSDLTVPSWAGNSKGYNQNARIPFEVFINKTGMVRKKDSSNKLYYEINVQNTQTITFTFINSIGDDLHLQDFVDLVTSYGTGIYWRPVLQIYSNSTNWFWNTPKEVAGDRITTTSGDEVSVTLNLTDSMFVENYYYHVCIGVGCVNSNFSSWKSGSDALFVVPFDKSTLPASSTWETRDVPFYFRFMPVSYFSRIIKVIGLSYYVTAPMPKWNDVTSQNQTFTITNMAEQLIGITFTITKEAQAVYFVKQNGTTSGQPLRIQVRESISGGGDVIKYLTPANPNNSWQESSPQYVGSGTREETVTLYGTFYMGNIPVGGYAEYHLWADSTNTGDMREAGYFSIRKIQY